jgi:hypothetical protein
MESGGGDLERTQGLGVVKLVVGKAAHRILYVEVADIVDVVVLLQVHLFGKPLDRRIRVDVGVNHVRELRLESLPQPVAAANLGLILKAADGRKRRASGGVCQYESRVVHEERWGDVHPVATRDELDLLDQRQRCAGGAVKVL